MSDVFLSKTIEGLLPSIDFSKLGNNVAIKVHFGERGCTTFMNPKIVEAVYDKVVSLGKKAALVETSVLYRGERTQASSHIKLAKEHGFSFAPIDILDGEMGHEFIEVKLKDGLANPVKIAKGLAKYDSLIVISHFKGHEFAGFGGTLKNLGMGMGSRAGKLHMHASVRPSVGPKCTGCGTCVKHCDFKAITLNKKAVIDPAKCSGCAMCIAVCPAKAIIIPWGSSSNDDMQRKMVDYARGALSLVKSAFFINIMEKMTKDCDCMSVNQPSLIPDVGILFSKDPVALDKACLDLAKCDFDNNVDKTVQIDYAQSKGLGSKDYTLRRNVL